MPRLRAQPEQCFDTCTSVQYIIGWTVIKQDRKPPVLVGHFIWLVMQCDHEGSAAAKFKEQCLKLLDEVDPEGILVTKRGKPVARLIPVERPGKAKLVQLGRLELDLRSSQLARALAAIHVWPIDLAVARASTSLDFKSDPADEIIAATSVVHSVPLVTRDKRIRRSRIVPLAKTR
jgi:prevent-host-death family protein